ncbi:MAG: 4Fe-4S dicluster domain-containing protein [Planctomycetota bacterium]
MSTSQKTNLPPVNVAAACDKEFTKKLLDSPVGEFIRRCFACGTCTAGCPIREVDARYNPRRIVRMILYGMKDELLRSDFVWLCANCYTCQERCPQGVCLTDVMRVLRNMAVAEGAPHPSLKLQAKALCTHGRMYEIEDFDNKKRVKAGMAELNTDLADLKTLLQKEGLDDKLK